MTTFLLFIMFLLGILALFNSLVEVNALVTRSHSCCSTWVGSSCRFESEILHLFVLLLPLRVLIFGLNCSLFDLFLFVKMIYNICAQSCHFLSSLESELL